ncbi:EcsC family protein [Mangrovivirga cuniculi]|uniref:ABC transporter-associated protein EcsC n=1 Tax=Mangrovivirga cuniculi TaxID=2715131 RepID=A0A4D7JG84_9BACT|nr:EcsC family protein [Mangrovivirga cuniculi]QCK15179.1 ABC transporter-associated protein EcsC [Mangrovivirga cuniculi]
MKIDQDYVDTIQSEYRLWQLKMSQSPSLMNQATKGIQHKINTLIPDKVHDFVTRAIKEITRTVIFGAEYTTLHQKDFRFFSEAEQFALRRIDFYASSSAAEGAITGFGGFISGLADFPLWLSLKMKLLFEVANGYGYDVKDYKERLYILHIFQLTFSSQKHRNEIFKIMKDWEKNSESLPTDINDFDWKTFQLEYRDFIDLAKLIQLIPGVGAIAGAYVNHKYTKILGRYAMNGYRLRLLDQQIK